MGYSSNIAVKKSVIITLGFIQELRGGLFYTFCVFYSSFVTDFNSTYAFMGLVGNLSSSISMLMSPVTATLVSYTSYGVTFAITGVLLSAAFYLTSLDTQYWQLILSYSILFGLANGFGTVIFNYYVDNLEEDLETAISAMNSASGLGIIIFCGLAVYLMNMGVSWRIIYQYFAISGLVYLLCTAGLTFFDSAQHKPIDFLAAAGCTTEEEREAEEGAESCEEMDIFRRSMSETGRLLPPSIPLPKPGEEGYISSRSGWALLSSSKDHRAMHLAIVHCIIFSTSIYPLKISMTYAAAISSSGDDVYYWMIVAIGVGVILSRLFTSFLPALLGPNAGGALAQTKIALTGGTLTLGCLSFFDVDNMSMVGACVGMGMYCFFMGAVITLIRLRVIEVLGKPNHLMNVNVNFFLMGCCGPFGSYFLGWVYDTTNSFRITFVVIAVFMIVALILDNVFFRKGGIVQVLSVLGHYMVRVKQPAYAGSNV